MAAFTAVRLLERERGALVQPRVTILARLFRYLSFFFDFIFNLHSCELAYMYAVTVTALYILLLTPCLVE